MTGTVHEIRPRTLQQRQEAIAPILPAIPPILDLAIHLERIRRAAETGLAVLRACPAATEAHTEHLDQVMGAYFDAEAANLALASLLQCEGQA
jgi:hypothetical protein